MAPSLQENITIEQEITTIETVDLSCEDIQGPEGGAILRDRLLRNRKVAKLTLLFNHNFGA